MGDKVKSQKMAQDQAQDQQARRDSARAGLTLLVFSTLMLVLPLGLYFTLRHFTDSTTVSALGAIVMVQIIIAGFIYRAWQDENKDAKKTKKHSE